MPLSAFRFDPAEWGTVADWVIGITFGLATVILAGMAAFWSRRAALAEERNARLLALTQRAEFTLTCEKRGERDDQVSFLLTFGLSPDSVPVWLRQVEILANHVAMGMEQHRALQEWFQDLRTKPFPYQGKGIFMSPGSTQTRSWDITKHEGLGPLELSEQWEARAIVKYTIESDTDPDSHIQTRSIEMIVLAS